MQSAGQICSTVRLSDDCPTTVRRLSINCPMTVRWLSYLRFGASSPPTILSDLGNANTTHANVRSNVKVTKETKIKFNTFISKKNYSKNQICNNLIVTKDCLSNWQIKVNVHHSIEENCNKWLWSFKLGDTKLHILAKNQQVKRKVLNLLKCKTQKNTWLKVNKYFIEKFVFSQLSIIPFQKTLKFVWICSLLSNNLLTKYWNWTTNIDILCLLLLIFWNS